MKEKKAKNIKHDNLQAGWKQNLKPKSVPIMHNVRSVNSNGVFNGEIINVPEGKF